MRSAIRPWIGALLLAAAVVPAARAQQLTGAGATFPYPIYSKWFDVYHEKTNVAINYQSIGSGAGIQQVKAGTVDFGASDAALSDATMKDLPRRVVHIPTVGGAVVLAYNLPGFQGRLQLTPDVLSAIYLGSITTWNDKKLAAANPGVTLPAAPILAVHRSDGSGTTNIFTLYLSAVSSKWKDLAGAGTAVSWPSGVGGKGNDGVAGVIKQTPGAIGYVELAYAKQNQLPMAYVQNRSGKYVEPSAASVTAAMTGVAAQLAKDVRTPVVNSPSPDAWPISGLTFLIVYQDAKDPARGQALARFLDWAIHDGQTYADALDYARLPDAIVKVNEGTLKLLTAGGKRIASSSNP
jgi:phosphate transport system substrate-binding protein